MDKSANPEMLILAREIRGLTQTELAAQTGIDQGRISRYESGDRLIPQAEFQILADILRFPVEFFNFEGERRSAETSEIFHRKRQSVSVIDQKQIDRLLDIYHLGINELLKSFERFSPYSMPKYNLHDYDGDAQKIASLVRRDWALPSGPVDNLIARLESASCMIFPVDFGAIKMDEVAQWVEPMPPIILVNNRAPGSRLRFSLAHALGHLVMHHNEVPYSEMEQEADRFASAFLMPVNDIKPELAPVTIDHMLRLKSRWKVSMQALIHRALDVGEINDRQYTSLFQMLSRVGYRKNEPFEIPIEKPELVNVLLGTYKQQLNYDDNKLARLVRLQVEDFQKWYYPQEYRFHL